MKGRNECWRCMKPMHLKETETRRVMSGFHTGTMSIDVFECETCGNAERWPTVIEWDVIKNLEALRKTLIEAFPFLGRFLTPKL